MKEEQFNNFKKMISYEAKQSMDEFIKMEIEAQPNIKDFLEGVACSDFFTQFFERGFIEGIRWQRKNKDTKFVL
jgi:hypothetical protein